MPDLYIVVGVILFGIFASIMLAGRYGGSRKPRTLAVSFESRDGPALGPGFGAGYLGRPNSRITSKFQKTRQRGSMAALALTVKEPRLGVGQGLGPGPSPFGMTHPAGKLAGFFIPCLVRRPKLPERCPNFAFLLLCVPKTKSARTDDAVRPERDVTARCQ
jgi:hypothetical protein